MSSDEFPPEEGRWPAEVVALGRAAQAVLPSAGETHFAPSDGALERHNAAVRGDSSMKTNGIFPRESHWRHLPNAQFLTLRPLG